MASELRIKSQSSHNPSDFLPPIIRCGVCRLLVNGGTASNPPGVMRRTPTPQHRGIFVIAQGRLGKLRSELFVAFTHADAMMTSCQNRQHLFPKSPVKEYSDYGKYLGGR